MWPIKTCIFVFGFISSCGLSLVFPIVGIITYMMIYQLNPDDTWWGKPLEDLDVRMSLTAAVCMILGMLINSARVPKSRQVVGDWLFLLVSFTIIVLSSLWIGTGTTEYGDMLADKMVKMTIFLFCLVRMGGTARNFRFVLWAFAIGTMYIGYEAYNASASDFADGRLNFIGGPDFRESSGLAVHMAAMLPLLGILFLSTKRWRWKAVLVIAGVLAVNTIVQCRTRSAFVGLIVGSCFAILLLPRKHRLKISVSLATAMFGMYVLADEHFWNRMHTILGHETYVEEGAIQARIELWNAGWRMFLDHPFGVGIGQFKQAVEQYNTGAELYAFSVPRRVTHNSYLLCMTELGIQGLTVLFSLFVLTFWKLRQCWKWSRIEGDSSPIKLYAYGCLISIVVYSVAAAFTDRLYTESFWWVLALPACLERAAVHRFAGQFGVTEQIEEEQSPPDPVVDLEMGVEVDIAWPPTPRRSLHGAVKHLNPAYATPHIPHNLPGGLSKPTFSEITSLSRHAQKRVPESLLAGSGLKSIEQSASSDTISQTVDSLLGDAAHKTRMFDLEEGVGKRAARADSVTVSYQGQLASGVVFDTANHERIELNSIMPELSLGIRTMREAGRRRIVIPPKDSGEETLIFDVTLLEVHVND
ncbi:MAG TPA: O-antigen ligase family protein [Phycisphaerae bacterium]|nr:O-antigen ligase family protein [Phycisphaerae bacterium]